MLTLNDLLVALSILAILLGGLLWIIKMQVAGIKHETSPNSGGSMKDKVNLTHELLVKMDKNQAEWRDEQSKHNDRIYAAIGKAHGRIDEHIHDHLTGSTE